MPRPELVLADQCYRWMHQIAGLATSPLLCGIEQAHLRMTGAVAPTGGVPKYPAHFN